MVRRFSFFVLILNLAVAHGQERITSFTSNLIVNEDATLRVKETIEVISTGDAIIHGIVREFPTDYADLYVINYKVGFNVETVTQDGKPAQFWVESAENGKNIYIGNKYDLLPAGKHTYTITYTTNRQLGFFNNHDELYWNVTGNGWRLPIDTVHASIQLPKSIKSSSIKAEGYTGFQGEQAQDYTVAINGSRVTFSTTHNLEPNQGLTVVVTWPKGFVREPSWYQKLSWFLKDNLFLLWTLFVLMLLIILIVWCYICAQRKNKPGTIIPLFYPPAGLTPSVVGFMKARSFREGLLAADIVHLAVRGFITITCEQRGFFSKNNRYTLSLVSATDNQKETLSEYETKLLETLFGRTKFSQWAGTVVMTNDNLLAIESALNTVNTYCRKQTATYIVTLNTILYVGYALCALWIAGMIYTVAFGWMFGFFIFLIIASQIKHFYHVYTLEGRKLQDEIDGFELYLKTAEVERMNIIGTPPIKTPELYEHYLPYAIALGVEKQWTQQFASVFAALAQQGHAYTPGWYMGRPFSSSSFASDMGSSFNKAISSSSQVPGSSSGSGGRGSSGGGGGGGGGGGW